VALAAVTAATGPLGANVARALIDAGHQVRAVRRRSSRVDHLDGLDKLAVSLEVACTLGPRQESPSAAGSAW
jgi:uncharacterized protein YbjT (DUF2867 family)